MAATESKTYPITPEQIKSVNLAISNGADTTLKKLTFSFTNWQQL